MYTRINIKTPDDWHLHLRDGEMLKAVIGYTSFHFARAIIMPNLVPPVVTTADASAYRERIMAAKPKADFFKPLMTLYLTEESDGDDIVAGFRDGLITAVKLYPAGATTNSASGVKDIEKVMPVLEKMAAAGVSLCVHGEVTDPEVDIFDREAVFIDRVLAPLRNRLPELRIVMEHVTTEDGVSFVESGGTGIAATITVHHLMINRNAIFAGGIRPHYYCLPVAKREKHRSALRTAATSGSEKFFLGTDSAPHTDAAKLQPCGCAGCFTAPNALACLAQVFEQEQKLGNLEKFASLNGPAFYGLPPNESTISLVRQPEPVKFPDKIQTGAGEVTVFDPGMPVYWKIEKG